MEMDLFTAKTNSCAYRNDHARDEVAVTNSRQASIEHWLNFANPLHPERLHLISFRGWRNRGRRNSPENGQRCSINIKRV